MSGEKALCTLPKVTRDGETKIECVLQDKLRDSKIMISQCSALDGYNPMFKLNKIETKKKVRIPNGKVIKMKKLFNVNLSFGQLNRFLKINKSITFFFIGFSGQPIKKGDPLNMTVNLIKGKDLIEEDVKCVAEHDINPKDGKQVQIKFECKIENVENPDEYTGLILSSSDQINGIPIEENLLNPATVDILIENGTIKNYTSSENEEIPIFNSTSIDTSESDKTGKFIINGKFLSEYKTINKIDFEIVLLSGEKALCTLPKVTGEGEVQIECKLQQDIKGTKIMIGPCPAFYKFNPIFNFYKIATIKEIKMPNRNTILDDIFRKSLSFGQLNRFRTGPKLITFFFVGFTGRPIKKYATINMKVNLIRGNDILKKNVKCRAIEDVEPKDGKQSKVNFECRIENIDKAEEFIGAVLFECDDINSIPTEEVLLNPAQVDILIQQGEVKNYTSEETEKEEIPVFNSTSIDTTDSSKTGKFIINGKFLSDYKPTKKFEFVLTLMSGEKALCKLPKVNKEGEVKIECVLQEKLNGNKIRIGQCSGFDKFNEVIRLNKIISDDIITIPNGKLILLDKLFDLNLSFGQLNRFRKKDKSVEFIFVGLTPKPIKKDVTIKMLVDLLKDDDILGEEEAICNATKDVDPKDGKLLLVTFECKVDNIEEVVKNCTSLELVSTDDFSGIPKDKNLKNPVLVEELIISGEVQNYTSEDFEKEEIPIFNSTSIDTTDSEKTGKFVINGDLLSDLPINKTFEFELLLMSGEKALCTIPKKSKKGKVKIECLLLNDLIDTKIMIEQCSILDGYKEVFRLNRIANDKEKILPNGKKIKLDKLFEINLSFGQVSNFLVRNNIISFFFNGFTPKPIKKDESITFVVNLIKDNELVEEKVKCTSKNEVNPPDKKFKQVDFECKLENVPEPEKLKGLIIVSSEDVTGIPKEKEDLVNPVLVDEIIRTGELKNLSLDDNKNQTELVPIFEPKSIDTSECLTNGVFIIIGEPLSDFKLDKELEFEIKLVSGEKAKCILPEVSTEDKEIKIKCELQEELKDTKIMIEPLTALDGYNEVIRLNKFSTDKEVSAANGKEKKFRKKFNRKFSFRQTNNFKFDLPNKSVTFLIFAFTNEPIKKVDEFDIDVNLLLTIDSKKGKAKCKPRKDITLPGSKKQVPVALECKFDNLVLEKNINCTGLEIEDSDIIANIPKDPKLRNPKKSDKLIALGEMEEAKDEEDNIPEFNATLIDTNNSISEGIFKIVGKPLVDIEKDFIFNITLVSGQIALCKLPKSAKNAEVKIECELDGTIEKDFIMIPYTTLFKGYKEIFKLNKIATKREVSCSNGKLKKKNKLLDKKISFRQISHFKPVDKKISFILSAFIKENMEKGKPITLDINLEKEKNVFSPEKVVCKLNEEVKIGDQNTPIPSDFECTLENIDNAEKAVGLEITSSDEITGIPTNPNMTNPAEVDKLIKDEKILDLTLEENKKKLPPLFKPISINSLGCRGTGTFKVRGKFDKKIEHFRFNLPLSYPEINTRCDVPEAKEGEEIEVTCKTRSPFSSSKIIIEQSTINKNNSEVVSLLPISSENEVTCEDFSKVYSRKMVKKFKAPFSFRQTRKFSNNAGKLIFFILVLKTDFYTNEKSVTIKINVILKSTLRNLAEMPTIELTCPIDSSDNEKAEFKCELNGQPNSDGVIILDSDDINGIPADQQLINPVKVDDLIKNGILKSGDSTLPTVSEGKINYDDCEKKGIINLNDLKIDEGVKDGTVFNLSYSPESYGDCKIETEKKKIECYNKEEIESDKIIIPETVVRNKEDNTDLFRLKGLVSDDDDITCAINDNSHSQTIIPQTTTVVVDTTADTSIGEGNLTYVEKFKHYKEESSSGLGAGGIVAIIVACVLVLIALFVLLWLLKTGRLGGRHDIGVKPNIENTNAFSNNSIGQFKAQD